MERFNNWFIANGGTLHAGAQFVEVEDGRYNVRVRPGYTICEDTIIISCPTALTFSFMTYEERDQVGYISRIDRSSLSQDVVLRLTLMEQYLLGEESFWWPYISALPQPSLSPVSRESSIEDVVRPLRKQPFHTPLFFNEEDMLWLKGTNLGAAAESRANAWRDEFKEAKDSLEGLDESKKALWTSDLYVWAATVFTTRSFSASALRIPGLDSPVLVPGVDFLNHSPRARVTWIWGPSACSVQTNKALIPGNEILNNYGSKGNEELLMGYGFCLESNPADSFNLSYSSELSQHIKAAKARRNDSDETATASDIQPPSIQTNEDRDLNTQDTSTSQNSVKDVKFVNFGDGDYQFCAGFLADCSLALQNKRERKHDLACNPFITRFSNNTLSRNKLHTLSSIIMILQQKQMDIRQHDGVLPSSPKNRNQVYASIYRSSQLRILEGVLRGLSSTIHSIMQLNFGELPRIVRLVDILQAHPKVLKRHIREVVHVGVRTREANKIVERGGVKFAFAIWLCGLRLLHLSGDLIRQEPVLSKWVDFLCKHYNDRAFDESTHDGSVEAEEMVVTVRSYANAIQIAVEKHPGSLYNDEWARNHANLMWCIAVIKEEGVRCPTVTENGILGEERDEFVVVIDDEDTR